MTPGQAARCKLHPKYKAMRRPTSERPGCKCMSLWNIAQGAREYERYLAYRKHKDEHDAIYVDPFEDGWP